MPLEPSLRFAAAGGDAGEIGDFRSPLKREMAPATPRFQPGISRIEEDYTENKTQFSFPAPVIPAPRRAAGWPFPAPA